VFTLHHYYFRYSREVTYRKIIIRISIRYEYRYGLKVKSIFIRN